MQKMAKLLIATLVLLAVIVGAQEEKKCRLLALAGGGDAGSYQAGAIKGLVEAEPTTHWDVVTGISVGSLNGAGLSIFEIGQEKAAADFLVQTWKGIKGYKDIYQNYWLGPLYGLLKKSGIYDVAPLRKLLTNMLKDKKLKRQFLLGATNIREGTYDLYHEQNMEPFELVDAIMSSAAYPVLLPSADFRNNKYMDGGVKNAIDVSAGIHKCLDAGFSQKEIVIDIILCSSKHLSLIDASHARPLNILNRVIQLYSYDKVVRNVDDIMLIFPDIKYRYVVTPSIVLPSGDLPLNFSHAQIELMINQGIEDAKKTVEEGPGVSFKKMVKEFREDLIKELTTSPFKKTESKKDIVEAAFNKALEEVFLEN